MIGAVVLQVAAQPPQRNLIVQVWVIAATDAAIV
jgi:hypothetical protein